MPSEGELESAEPDKKTDPAADEGKSPASDRVEALTPKPEPGQASQRLKEQKRAEEKAAGKGKPVLTEKQRVEARRLRQATRKQRPAKAKRQPAGGNVLSRGLRASIVEFRRTFIFLGRSVFGGLDRVKPLGGLIASGLAGLLHAVRRGAAAGAALAGSALRIVGRVLLALDRAVTARRGLIVIAFAAGGLLIVSQFLDFRAIEVGQPGYADVQEITRAPRLEAQTPLDNHSLLLVAAGALAVVAAAGAALSRRRVTGLVLVLTGALAIAVAMLIDLPAARDTADAELAFVGVNGVLLSGFWLELGAGTVLMVSGIGLVFDAPAVKRSGARRQRTVNSPATGSRA